jgi:hypothetical protein
MTPVVTSPLHLQGQAEHLGVAFRSESGNINSSYVIGSHTSVALNDGVHGISVDWPGTSNFQQPLNYRGMPRSVDRIASGHHVYIARKAPPKASLGCSFHRSIPAALGRLTSKAKPERQLSGENPRTPPYRSPSLTLHNSCNSFHLWQKVNNSWLTSASRPFRIARPHAAPAAAPSGPLRNAC